MNRQLPGRGGAGQGRERTLFGWAVVMMVGVVMGEATRGTSEADGAGRYAHDGESKHMGAGDVVD